MEGAGKYDDVFPSGKGLRDLYRVLVSLRTAVGKEGLLLFALDRGDGTEFLGQLYIALVGADIEHAVKIFVRLFLYRLHNFRLGVSDIQHADTADPVEEFIAVHILNHCALAPVNNQGIGTADGGGRGGCPPVNQRLGFRSGQCLRNNLR